MDNGEEIQGLDEGWTFLGAKLMEWAAGFCAFMIASELFFTNMGRNVPILIAIWIGSTVGMARLRKMYPDEERGIANHLLTMMGFAPPGIPRPSSLQPRWSGGRLREPAEESFYVLLKLNEIFVPKEEEDDEPKEVRGRASSKSEKSTEKDPT